MQNADQAAATLDKMMALELAVARLYDACKEQWPEEAGFWEPVVQAEMMHAQLVANMKTLVAQHPDQFRADPLFKPTVAEAFITRANETAARVRQGGLTKLAALAVARDIEESLLERRLPDLLVSENREFVEIRDRIMGDTRAHRALFHDRIAAVKGPGKA